MVGGLEALGSLESILSFALSVRGQKPIVLLCDAALPACLRLDYSSFPDQASILNQTISESVCVECQKTGLTMFRNVGADVLILGSYLTEEDRFQARDLAASISIDKIRGYRWRGIPVGEHAYAGALRYFARGNLQAEPNGEGILRRYLEAAFLTAAGTTRLLQSHQFSAACFNHGIYIPHGVISEVCRLHGVRISTWNIAYRKQCFIFSHGDTYHHTLMQEPVSAWEQIPWNPARQAKIEDYLLSRRQGTRDWIWFHEKPENPQPGMTLLRQLGLDPAKPVIGLLTNVMWDAQLHYPANTFPDMLTWVLKTVEYFRQRQDLQLVIRIHPAEIRGTLPSRQPLAAELEKIGEGLPKNVRVIRPEDPASTYAVMELCNCVIIYGTKTGVELTSLGIPVIVAGEAWIRNKGITRDASTPAEYFRLLDQLPFADKMDPAQQIRALKYAYHFFFRRMIPLKFMEETRSWPPYRAAISGPKDLLPGRDRGLDVICNGILEGAPFIYPEEEMETEGKG
ncbi:capsule biosynthesis protein [bacterium]|nr:capsule biosynthesis protein [bacterium]